MTIPYKGAGVLAEVSAEIHDGFAQTETQAIRSFPKGCCAECRPICALGWCSLIKTCFSDVW